MNFFDAVGDLKTNVFDAFWSCKDNTKTPGSPLVFGFPTNAATQAVKAEIYDNVNFRVKQLIKLGKLLWSDKSFETPISPKMRMEMVERGLMDPVLVGLKSEPRKNGKVPRLVSLVSLVDNLVTRIAYQNHLVQEQMSPEVSCAVRLDLTTQSVMRRRHALFASHAPLAGNDCQGWEYSLNASDQFAGCFVKCYQMGLISSDGNVIGDANHFYLILALTYTIVNKINQLPEGLLVAGPPGTMPSGSLITYSMNSAIRANLSDNVSWDTTGKNVEYVVTAGDDCLDKNVFSTVEESERAHLPYGKVITDSEVACETFDFCSTRFGDPYSYGLNIDKSVYAMVCNDRMAEEDFVQFSSLYAHHPDYADKISLIGFKSSL